MRKEYLKPEMDVMEFIGETLMLDASNPNEGNIPGEDGEITDPAANNRRGGWGDLWN